MEKEEIGNLSENLTFRKMRINCNLNQILDVYYQLYYELFVEGKSFVDRSKSDLIDIICNSFDDKDGNEISPATVETILRPSKNEKKDLNRTNASI